jgi:hypothetical protein
VYFLNLKLGIFEMAKKIILEPIAILFLFDFYESASLV